MTDQNNKNEAEIGQDNLSNTIEAFKRFSANSDTAASEITRGEFSKSGSGGAGSTFRKIEGLGDEDMVEVWGEILSLCAQLWEAEHVIASIVLIETSSNTFFIPESMETRVSVSIENARDLKIIKTAEDAFKEGDDEKAERMAANMKTSLRSKYLEDLKLRISTRQKTRTTALWIGGVSISSLLIVAGIGVASFIKFLDQPPRPELPKFEETQRIFNDILNNQNEPQESKISTTPVRPKTPNIPPLPAKEADNPAVDPVTPATAAPATTTPVEPKQVNSQTSSMIFGGDGEKTKTPQQALPKPILPESETEDAPEEIKGTPPAKLASRSDCIMGYAVVQRAAGLIQSQKRPEEASQKIAEFMESLESACKSLNLDPMAISLESGMLNSDKVYNIARNILR
jgi:hypothetical protein